MSDYEDFDLDEDVSEVSDIISFSNPPAGKHVYGIVFAGIDKLGKDESSSKGVRILYQHVNTIQKANADDMDCAVGSIFSEQFMGGEIGKKWLKKRLKDMFGEVTGSFGPYIRQLNEKKMSEYMLEMTTTIAKSKKEGVEYENVRIQDIKMISPLPLPEGYEIFEYEPSTSD